MTVNSRNPVSLRITREDRNRDRLLTCALCVLLALPGLAAARKPASNNSSTGSTSTDSGCAVLLPAYIETGGSFSVKVVKVPSYPGSWVMPTIYTDVVYPTTGSDLTQSYTQTINKFNVTYALASFMVPSMGTSDIASSPTTSNATATVTATVSEPLSNNKVKLSTCSATTPVMGVN
jgi:hypothetical protein